MQEVLIKELGANSEESVKKNRHNVKSTKLAIFRDMLVYSGSSFVVQGIAFFLAIFVRSALGPEAMGVWALLQVFLTYAGFGSLGMLTAVCREIPILRGQGNSGDRILRIKNAGFTYLFLVSAVVSLALTIGGTLLFVSNRLSADLFFGLLTISIVNILQRINNLQVQILHVENEFVLVSRFKVYSAIVNALLVFILVWRYGLNGFFVGTILSYGFNLLYLCLIKKMTFQLNWDREEIRQLLKSGVFLFALGMLTTLFSSIDKISIGKFLGLKQLGIYTIATLAGGYIYLIPNIFQVVLLGRTLEKFGNQDDVAGRETYSTRPGQLMAVYLSLCTAVIWITSPYLCGVFLPKYTEGIPALKILIFGYCFLVLTSQIGHVLMGYNKYRLMIPVALVLVVATLAGNYLAAKQGGGITVIAFITTVAYLMNYVICAVLAFRLLYSFRKGVVQLIFTLAPIAYGVAILVFFDMLHLQNSFGWIAIKLAVYVVLWVIFLLVFERKLGSIGVLKEVWTSWRKPAKERASYRLREEIEPINS